MNGKLQRKISNLVFTWRCKVILEKLAGLFSVVAFALAYSALLSLIAWPLWNNCLVGVIDGIHQVGYFQVMGIMCLVNIFSPSGTKD